MDKTTTSGWHLMLDAIVREPGWISSPEKIREFLLGLIPRLGMELLDGPRITEVDLEGLGTEDEGLIERSQLSPRYRERGEGRTH